MLAFSVRPDQLLKILSFLFGVFSRGYSQTKQQINQKNQKNVFIYRVKGEAISATRVILLQMRPARREFLKFVDRAAWCGYIEAEDQNAVFITHVNICIIPRVREIICLKGIAFQSSSIMLDIR